MSEKLYTELDVTALKQNYEAAQREINRQMDQANLWLAFSLALLFILGLIALLHFTHYNYP